MLNNSDNNDINQRAEQIDAIYNDYVAKLTELKKRQTKVLEIFVKGLEQKKIDAVRKLLE